MPTRREFVSRIGAAGATAVWAAAVSRAATDRRLHIVDTNVNLFQWPFRRLPLDRTEALVTKMTELGITTAWAGSFEGLLHRDMAGVNQRLAEECRRSGGRLRAFGTVNPALPDWEDDVRRCHETFGMPGIRLHPNYHGYTLEDPRFERLLAAAAGRGILVQIATSMEDGRTQHPLVAVPDVDLRPLPAIAARHLQARIQLLNVGRGAAALMKSLAEMPSIHFDTARIEGSGAIGAFLRSLPAGRVVFGTHAPFFILEAGLIKVVESALSDAEAARLLRGNADALVKPA